MMAPWTTDGASQWMVCITGPLERELKRTGLAHEGVGKRIVYGHGSAPYKSTSRMSHATRFSSTP